MRLRPDLVREIEGHAKRTGTTRFDAIRDCLAAGTETIRGREGVPGGRVEEPLGAIEGVRLALDLLGPPTLGTQRLLAHWPARDGGVKVSEDELPAEVLRPRPGSSRGAGPLHRAPRRRTDRRPAARALRDRRAISCPQRRREGDPEGSPRGWPGPLGVGHDTLDSGVRPSTKSHRLFAPRSCISLIQLLADPRCGGWLIAPSDLPRGRVAKRRSGRTPCRRRRRIAEVMLCAPARRPALSMLTHPTSSLRDPAELSTTTRRLGSNSSRSLDCDLGEQYQHEPQQTTRRPLSDKGKPPARVGRKATGHAHGTAPDGRATEESGGPRLLTGRRLPKGDYRWSLHLPVRMVTFGSS